MDKIGKWNKLLLNRNSHVGGGGGRIDEFEIFGNDQISRSDQGVCKAGNINRAGKDLGGCGGIFGNPKVNNIRGNGDVGNLVALGRLTGGFDHHGDTG